MLTAADYEFLKAVLHTTIYKRFHMFYDVKPTFFDTAIRRARAYILEKSYYEPYLTVRSRSTYVPEAINEICLLWKPKVCEWRLVYYADDLIKLREIRVRDTVLQQLKELALNLKLKFTAQNRETLRTHKEFCISALYIIRKESEFSTFLESFCEFVDAGSAPLGFRESDSGYFKVLVQECNRRMPGYEDQERQVNEKYIRTIMEVMKYLVYVENIQDASIRTFVAACELRDMCIDVFACFRTCASPEADAEIIADVIATFDFHRIARDIHNNILPALVDDYSQHMQNIIQHARSTALREHVLNFHNMLAWTHPDSKLHTCTQDILTYIDDHTDVTEHISTLQSLVYDASPIHIVRECAQRVLVLINIYDYLYDLARVANLRPVERLNVEHIRKLQSYDMAEITILIQKYHEDTEAQVSVEQAAQNMKIVLSPESFRMKTEVFRKSLIRSKYGGSKYDFVEHLKRRSKGSYEIM